MTAGLIPVHLAGIGFALQQSNLAGKIIVGFLFVGSIFAWSIMVTKIKELRQARIMSRRFLEAYRRESHPAALFLRRARFEGSPLATIYEKTYEALGTALDTGGTDREDLFMGGVSSERRWLDDVQMGWVRNVAERTLSDQSLLLETSMGLLATAASTAPFLGLLGTVWGVMEAFGGMAVKGTAMLSAVAPGISGALLTTVVGLLVALPSAIGYNMLSDRVRRLSVAMDNFTQELAADVERYYRRKTQES